MKTFQYITECEARRVFNPYDHVICRHKHEVYEGEKPENFHGQDCTVTDDTVAIFPVLQTVKDRSYVEIFTILPRWYWEQIQRTITSNPIEQVFAARTRK